MNDQANQLRQLVHRAAADDGRRPPRSRLVAVAGGKGGVGTTTVAVNLAAELARRGRQTILVDADPDGGDAATLCKLVDRHTISDVAAGRQSAPAALQPGPAGLQVLPGAWAIDSLAELPADAQDRLLRQLDALTDHGDVVVVDAGNGRSRLARRLWEAAGRVVVVTTTELASVMDAYGSIKVLSPHDESATVFTLVNFASGVLPASDAQRRLAEACRRFLGIKIVPMGHLDQEPQFAESTAGRSGPVPPPQSRFARQIRTAASRLALPPGSNAARPDRPTAGLPARRAG